MTENGKVSPGRSSLPAASSGASPRSGNQRWRFFGEREAGKQKAETRLVEDAGVAGQEDDHGILRAVPDRFFQLTKC